MKKSNVILISVLSGILVLLVLGKIFFGNSYNYDGVVKNPEDAYAVIKEAVLKGKGEISFDSFVHPGFLDFDRILMDAVADGSYIGCELYSLKYVYTVAGGVYHVDIELHSPNRLSSKLMELRAGRIASNFEDLETDYDKVKAAHDYLVLLNRYVYFEGGAYSALYKARSSCTGYAYAFYAIMNKLDIPVTIEVGGNHAWNRVKVGDYWYNIDCTWDDPDWMEISYDYFLKSDADWRGHHHGGSDAPASLPVRGKSAKENYDLVPAYNTFREIIIILIVVVPVAIFAYIITKRGKKEKDIVQYSMLTAGEWYLMPPMRVNERYNVIVKKCPKPEKSEIWYALEGKYYVEKIEEKSPATVDEISEDKFFGELQFMISAARARNASAYHQMLQNAEESLSGGRTKQRLPW